MKDVLGTELENGQKVIFSVGTRLVTGVLQRVRTRGGRYSGQKIAVIKLDKPEKRVKAPVYSWNNINYVRTLVKPAEPLPDRTVREVHHENRICVIG